MALKFLPPHLNADNDAKRRFAHEAKAASALDHPGICAVHEIGETDAGQLFIAMAYCDGETLKKKSPWSLTSRAGARVCRPGSGALQRAHEAGLCIAT